MISLIKYQKQISVLLTKYWFNFILHICIWFSIATLIGTKVQTFDASFYLNSNEGLYPKAFSLRGYFLPLISEIIKFFKNLLNISSESVILYFNSLIFALISSILITYLIKYFILNLNIFFSAVNIRLAYLGLLLFLPIIFAIKEFDLNKSVINNLKKISIYVLLFVLSFLAISIPQLLINHNQVSKSSLFPIGNYPPVNYFTRLGFIPLPKENISDMQLSMGLGLQKYETNIDQRYMATFQYMDSNGMDLVKRYLPLNSKKDYLKLFYKEPKAMSKIYVKHFLNGFDVSYDTPYITPKDITSPIARSIIYFLFGCFTVLMFASLFLKNKTILKKWNLIAALAILIVSVAMALPGAIETRFFLLPLLLIPIFTANYLFTEFKSLLNHKIFFVILMSIGIITSIVYFQYSSIISETLIYK